jgi:adenosylmethionine-8-amino-7-oxononanoate aminotransferase
MAESDGDAAARRRIVELDKARVWHPYTEMSGYRETAEPLVIVRAEGSRLYDADGSCYLDANASWWTSALGHNHPRLVAALQRQSERLCHTALAGITHQPAAELAESLCAVAPPGLEHVFFSDNGSTAIEVAMKLCLQYWQQNGRSSRRTFLALEDAFHGETLGVTALGGVEVFRKPFDGCLLECIHIPSPAGPGGSARALEALRAALVANAESLAGVVLEPMVQGVAGMQIYDAEFLRAARVLCDEADVFLVSDEVFAGYGRTGPMWACQHADVIPDILCTAKGFSGGMLPMAATLATERVFQGFLGAPERAFYYGHTFCGNPLGAAIALEVLQVFEDEAILEAAAPKAERIARAFGEMASLPGVSRARWLGMIGALDLEGEEGYLAQAGWRVYDEARARGAYLRPLGSVVYVTPSLNIPDPDLDLLLEIAQESVAAAVG